MMLLKNIVLKPKTLLITKIVSFPLNDPKAFLLAIFNFDMWVL